MFRFTIRELVLLTLVVGMGIGWWTEHRQLMKTHRQLARTETYKELYSDALSQTTLALYDLGIHWSSLNGRVTLRPVVHGDVRPERDSKDDPPIQPNFDISQFAGRRMTDLPLQLPSRAEPLPKANPLAPSSAPNVEKDPAPAKTITAEEAADIVRRMILKESGEDTVFDCAVSETNEGYRVFVTFGNGRDPDGKLIGMYPGGHALYMLSKAGEVLKMVGGA